MSAWLVWANRSDFKDTRFYRDLFVFGGKTAIDK